MKWYSIDLHIHSPASSDYQQPGISILEMLQQAEARNLTAIAITDHNTVAGYRKFMEDIEKLTFLHDLGRSTPEEEFQLQEYKRLTKKILVLPGFEFTATFGFHILGIFNPDIPIREIEHLLLDLNIPPDQLDEGSVTVGASSDVLTAYRFIEEAGGISIAAHANSNNGVAMVGFPLGGQTKIAYTQDSHLHALEVTDLESKKGRNTAAFFSGKKPEYPRRMHCIQGSDAHRLTVDPKRRKNLGIGDRATDVNLPELSFEALLNLFKSNDFTRTRAHRRTAEPAIDHIRASQEEGPNIIQDFHETMTVRGGKRYAIIADVCALANTNGGTLYIGISADQKKPVPGISNPNQSISQLKKEIDNRLSPPLTYTIDLQQTNHKQVIRILVPRGDDPPYTVDDSKIYIRSEAETGLAVRDEIVGLVSRGLSQRINKEDLPSRLMDGQKPEKSSNATFEVGAFEDIENNAPKIGVEVVSVEERNGRFYYTVRDLRNGNVVKNVTPSSARKLWHYAITRYSKLPENPGLSKEIIWQGDYGIIHRRKQGKSVRYDFIQKIGKDYRYYFGVTEDGIHGPWKSLVGNNEE